MIQAKIINRINFPKIALQEDLESIAKDIIIPDMQNRIRQHKAITGGPFLELEQSTIDRKGHSKQLIDTGILLDSFEFKKEGKDTVKIFLGSERADIGLYLQSGIPSNIGIKAYPFFGISIFAHRKAMTYMKKRIEEMTRPSYAGAGI